MRTRFAWLLLLPLGLAFGCDGDNNDPDTDPPVGDDDDDDVPPGDDDDDPALEESRVRVLNLSDDLGVADLYVERIDSTDDALDLDERSGDEIVLFEDLDVAETSPYLAVVAGEREIELYAAGSDTPALELDVALEADMDHTVVVYGDLPDLDTLVIEDDTSAIPADAIALELMNVDEAATDMTVYDATAPLPAVLLAEIPADGQPVSADSSVRVEIGAEVGSLGIDLDGDAIIDFAFDLPLDLQLGELYHLALRGDGAGGMDVFLVGPDGNTQEIEPVPEPLAQVRLASLAQDLGDADVLLERVPEDGADLPLIDRPADEVLTFDSIGFSTVTPYSGIAAGLRDLEIYDAGAVTPFVDTAIDALGDESHTVFLYGTAPAVDAMAVVDDADAVPAGQAMLVFTHLDADLGVVDILDLTDPGAPVVIVDELAFETTARVAVDPAIDTIGIDTDDDGIAESTAILDLAPIAPDGLVHMGMGENLVGTTVFLAVAEDGTTAVIGAIPVGP